MINGQGVLNAAKYFIEDGSQNHSIFQPLKYFKPITNNVVLTWKSKGLSYKSIVLIRYQSQFWARLF